MLVQERAAWMGGITEIGAPAFSGRYLTSAGCKQTWVATVPVYGWFTWTKGLRVALRPSNRESQGTSKNCTIDFPYPSS